MKKFKVVQAVEAKEAYNAPSLFNKDFKYLNAASTDVRTTWAKYGWKPTKKGERQQ
jgi:hypothetical protein